MCGIVGYSGFREATEVLIEGLRNLEYRGYDSAGVSVFENGEIVTAKARGRLVCLEKNLADHPLHGHCGIGHTRWATHGAPSDVNAHPHTAPRVALIHNGIVENYLELRKMLQDKGYIFASQTDTEVAAKLVDFLYDGDPLATIAKALEMIEGSYAFSILFKDFPNRVFGAKKDNPLIVAVGEGENFILSDISATLKYTKNFYVLDDGDIVEIAPDGVRLFDSKLQPVERELHQASWDLEQAQKGGFPHFMVKEIFEQPVALYNTVHTRLRDALPDFSGDGIDDRLFTDSERIVFVACGTASYAGRVGNYLIEKLARIPASVEIASEFRYNDPLLTDKDLVIIISQSGETADSLAALRLAKEKGAHTLAVVNVIGSTIAREADSVIYTFAGPEIAVASTKAYTVQVGIMYLLAFSFAWKRNVIDAAQCEALCRSLLGCTSSIKTALEQNDAVKAVAEVFFDSNNLFYLGRGLDYPMALEGSLKLKETTYIHSEAYPSGELKHGPISLIVEGMPVIAIATQTPVLAKTVSNIKEVRARGAKTLLICREGVEVDPDAYDYRLDIPDVDDLFTPFPTAVIMQLLAYHKAVANGGDVDKPRNLAKSVTVE